MRGDVMPANSASSASFAVNEGLDSGFCCYSAIFLARS
jgi:hypothetical protein